MKESRMQVSHKSQQSSFCLEFQQEQETSDQEACSPKKYVSKLNRSLLNTSCIHSANFSNQMLIEIPLIPNANKIQRLDLSLNQIKILHLDLPNLKELIANRNCIESLSEDLNSMQFLRILRVRENRISIIPYLQHIAILEIDGNPIKLITSQIAAINFKCLDFDWIDYLVPNIGAMNSADAYACFRELLDCVDFRKEKNRHFIDFGEVFRQRANNNSGHLLSSLIHKAITQRSGFFLEFIRVEYHHNQQKQLNLNELMFLGRPLLEYALENDNDQAVGLFMLRKRNLNDSDSFFLNLDLACRHSHLGLFEYLMSSSARKLMIAGKESHLISQLLTGFSLMKNSHLILNNILDYSFKTTAHRKLKIVLPSSYCVKDLQSIANGLMYILTNQDVRSQFVLEQEGDEIEEEPLLHFASASKNPELIRLLMKQGLNPFIRNAYGIPPKMIRGSLFGRKMFWKFEKQALTAMRQQESLNENIHLHPLQKLGQLPEELNTAQTPRARYPRKHSRACSQLLSNKEPNIVQSLEILQKVTMSMIPANQFISLQPVTKCKRSPFVGSPKLESSRLSLNRRDKERERESFQDEIFTLENIRDRSGGVISEQLIRMTARNSHVPKQEQQQHLTNLFSEAEGLKNYQLFHTILNLNVKYNYDYEIEQKQRPELNILSSPIRFCEDVPSADIGRRPRHTRLTKMNMRQRLTLTEHRSDLY